MKERLKKAAEDAATAGELDSVRAAMSIRVPGWGGEGGGSEARNSTRAEEEAGFR